MHLITSLVDALWVSTRYNAGRLLVLMGTQHTANRRKSKPLPCVSRIVVYKCRLVTTPQHIIISRMHFIMCSSYPGGFVYVSLHILTGHYSQSTQKIASYTLTNIIKANQSILAFVIAITFFLCTITFTKKMEKSTDSHYTLLALCLYCTDECVLCVQGRVQLIWRPMHACFFLHENWIILVVNIDFVKYM